MISSFYIFNDYALLVLRLALGLIFIVHGFRKIKNFSGTLAWLGGEGFKPGWLWGPILMFTEFVGGLALLLGFFTQPFSLLLAVNMMVAFFYNVKKKQPFLKVLELDIILIASVLLLATTGPGAYSLERLF